MEILKYVLAGLFILGALSSVFDIGKPRNPKTAGDVVMGIIATGILVFTLLN